MTQLETIEAVGFDALAVKPSHTDPSRVKSSPFDRFIIDFEGTEHYPSVSLIRELQASTNVRLTIPVRVDGFDPLGNRDYLDVLPQETKVVLVAGNPAYLSQAELNRRIAPRIGEVASEFTDVWVGTEGIPLIALATDATQFFLLSPESRNTVKAIRSAGYEGTIAVYAPTVISDDRNTILDAIGPYTARRDRVRRELKHPDSITDLDSGDRKVLLRAIQEFALTGSVPEINEQIQSLKNQGIDTVVSYLPTGIA